MLRSQMFDAIIGYNYEKHLWTYDCKYYLVDGWWVYIHNGERAFELDDFIRKSLEEYQPIVDQREAENQKEKKKRIKYKKAKIWIEVACSHCGGVIEQYYHNTRSISKLKEKTKDWITHPEHGILCPDCQKKLNVR